MKYQKTLLNVLIIFFLSFTLFVQAEDKLQEQKEQIENYIPALVTGIEASSHSVLYNEQISIKLGEFIKGREIANGLDRLINVVKVSHSAYNHDWYNIAKNIIDAHTSTFAAGEASILAMGSIGLFTVSAPIIIGGGIIAGIGTAVAYTEIDPIERIKNYALGIKYPYHKTYNKAVVSLFSCDLNNANKQINLAIKGCLILLGKSEAKCISIKSKRSDYMKKYNIKGLKLEDTVLFSQQSDEMRRFKGDLQSAEKVKKEHSDFLVKTLKFKGDLKKKDKSFNMLRGYYREQINFIRNTSSGYEACRKYSALYSKLNECGKKFIETSAPSLKLEKKKLMVTMNNKNSDMLLDREITLDNFDKSTSCLNIDNLLEKFANFQDKVNKTDLYLYFNNDCKLKNTKFDMKLQKVATKLYNKRDQCRLEDRDKVEDEEDAAADKAIAEKNKAEEEEEEKKDLAIRKADCKNKRPGSTPKYYPDTGDVDCICVEPLVLNDAHEKCITKDQAKQEKNNDEKNQEPKDDYKTPKENCLGPVFVWDNVKQRCITQAEANCLGPVFVWDKVKHRCITQYEANQEKDIEEEPENVAMAQSDYPINGTFYPGTVQDDWLKDCDKMLPGSIGVDGECVCPKGREKSKKLNICVVIADVNQTASGNKEKVFDQIVYHLEGEGYTPHWGGGSHRKKGFRNKLVTLKEPATEKYIQSIIDKVAEEAIKSPCDLTGIPGTPGYKTSPLIWEIGPDVTIIRGPTTGLSSELTKNNWEILSSDEPSLSKLQKGAGCKK